MIKENKRAVIYARTAASQERIDYALLGQVKECEAYCIEHGYTLQGIYQDIGYSGSQCDRPMLNKLREGVKQERPEKREFDVIVVVSIDRISREYAQAVIIIEELKQYGVTVESVTGEESSVTTMMQDIQQQFKLIERQAITARMRRDKAAKKAVQRQ